MFLERFSNLDKIERMNLHCSVLFPSVIGSSEDSDSLFFISANLSRGDSVIKIRLRE